MKVYFCVVNNYFITRNLSHELTGFLFGPQVQLLLLVDLCYWVAVCDLFLGLSSNINVRDGMANHALFLMNHC
jgi:hypothetical protein